MKTEIFDVQNITEDRAALESALAEPARMLREGKTVAFPTETVYGLGANALDEAAVRNIFTAKGRPSDNPLILHIAAREQLDALVKRVPEKALLLMDRFWPGPLSIIMEKAPAVPDCVTAGLGTAAIRMPENPEAQILLRLAAVPVAAPSANLSGKPSPTKPEHVLHDLDGRVDGIVLGRTCDVGIESTVIDLSCDPPVILRPGILIKEDIEAVIGPVLLSGTEKNKKTAENDRVIPKAPGMKYTHYAPDAPMTLFTGTDSEMIHSICSAASDALGLNRKVGILATADTLPFYENALNRYLKTGRCSVMSAGTRSDLKTVAHNIFNILRQFDEMKVDLILSESFHTEGIGFSIMNRMDKAASESK